MSDKWVKELVDWANACGEGEAGIRRRIATHIALQDELLGLYRESSIIPRGLKESEHAAWVMRHKILTDKIALLETKLKEG